MYDPELGRLVDAALVRIRAGMEAAAPFLARQVWAWMGDAGEIWTEPAERFTHPESFPMVLLPWWLEGTLHAPPELSFQASLVYSTLNGYLFIRLVDNVMDGHATVEPGLLPALGFFHTEFQAPYQRYFEAEHPFWALFRTVWFASADATVQDAGAATIDHDTFVQVAAQKTSAVKIPLAAVCYRFRRPDLVEPWSRFVDLFGCWHQMFNDLFDWRRDVELGTCTYLLSEASRRREAGEPVAGWVMRDGFDWGMARLQGWMAGLRALAGSLGSPALAAYLEARTALLDEQQARVKAGFQAMNDLAAVLDRAGGLALDAASVVLDTSTPKGE